MTPRQEPVRIEPHPAHERRIVRAAGFVPVEAKLQPPALRRGLVTRGPLVDVLREAETPVIRVTAPAGYGKSTLLAEWAEEDARPFVWLTVDRADNDPVTLTTYLVLALQRAEPVDSGVLAAQAGGARTMSTVVLPRLGRMIARRERPFVLVVDDAEALTSPAALEVLMAVANHLPERSRLVVCARSAPDLPWAQLRSQGRLLDIGTADLCLSQAEGAALLDAMGLRLDRREVTRLLERTEGWAAGLYLLALSLRQAAARQDPAAGDGDERVVTDFLRDELLGRLPGDLATFLTRASILDGLCGGLCDAVLQTTGSAQRLADLERANLFLVALDRHGEWYRFHRMFADMLSAELQRREPGLVPELHARAARWLQEHGDAEEAIQHAQAAGDVDTAAALIWSQVGPLLATGRRATIQRWLDGFTNDQVIGHPRLALAAAWCGVETGRPVDHWIAAAERGAVADEPGAGPTVASALAVLRATLARDGLARMRADAEEADRLQGADDPWRTLAQYYRAVALHLVGQREPAVGLLRETEDLAAELRLPSVQALCLGQRALLAMDGNDWDTGAALVDRALSALAAHDLLEVPTMVPVLCVAVLSLARQGRVEEARARARQALRMLALVERIAPWAAVQCRYVLGRAHLMLGDASAARMLLSEAQTQLRAVTDAVWLRDRLAEVWRQVEKQPLTLGAGPSTLTTAEMRVLQFLPTHLSFEQIGKRLYVSRNTVKTQAIAAYRKLGASSRAEAVERASALGLIER